MNYSLTYIGTIVSVAALVTKALGQNLPVSEEQLVSALTTLATVIGFVVTLVGRYRHGDITFYGAKK